MERRQTRRRWMIGAGAGTLLLLGGLLAGPVAGLAQDDPDADLSRDEAIAAAIAEFPGTTAVGVELDDEDGAPVYEIELSNGYDVEVDGNSGQVLGNQQDDDRDDNDRDDVTGDMPEAAITLDEAIAAAEGAADGAVEDIELEFHGDRLVYDVEIGNKDVTVDATDGSVVSVRDDD